MQWEKTRFGSSVETSPEETEIETWKIKGNETKIETYKLMGNNRLFFIHAVNWFVGLIGTDYLVADLLPNDTWNVKKIFCEGDNGPTSATRYSSYLKRSLGHKIRSLAWTNYSATLHFYSSLPSLRFAWALTHSACSFCLLACSIHLLTCSLCSLSLLRQFESM